MCPYFSGLYCIKYIIFAIDTRGGGVYTFTINTLYIKDLEQYVVSIIELF